MCCSLTPHSSFQKQKLQGSNQTSTSCEDGPETQTFKDGSSDAAHIQNCTVEEPIHNKSRQKSYQSPRGMQSNGHRVRLGCEENKEIALAAKRYFCDILEDLSATNKKLKARSSEFSAMLAFVVIPVLSQPRFLMIYSSFDLHNFLTIPFFSFLGPAWDYCFTVFRSWLFCGTARRTISSHFIIFIWRRALRGGLRKQKG